NPGRVEHRAELVPMVAALMRQRKTREWETLLEAAGVPHAPLWSYAELFAHPQAAPRGMRVTVRDPNGRPIDLVGSPCHVDSPGKGPAENRVEASCPPGLGEHTDVVLSELCGLGRDALERLRHEGVIA